MDKKEFYQKKAAEYPSFDKEAVFRYTKAVKLAEPKGKLLDIGCKYAVLQDILIEQGINLDYYGIDISENVLHKIKNYDPSRFRQADASKGIPFSSESFDFVFAMEILEHVESPTQMLSEIHRVLRNEGNLILSVPNVYCYSEILANIKKMPDTEGHISGFSFQIMERLLKFNDFKILDYCGTFVRVPFSSRFSKGSYKIMSSDNTFLTRSFIFKAGKIVSNK